MNRCNDVSILKNDSIVNDAPLLYVSCASPPLATPTIMTGKMRNRISRPISARFLPIIATLVIGSVDCRGQSPDATPTKSSNSTDARIVPRPPSGDQPLPLLIDSDVANEIDDLYAIALALAAPEKFELRGIVATHFAQWAGPDSTQKSYDVLQELLNASGNETPCPIALGGDPMQYTGVPTSSEGADLIVRLAREASPENPLWVVVLGAATNTASAILQAPSIQDNIRVLFHARCAHHWPERTVQFNVVGDVIAVQTLLKSRAPLVWFDTGTKLTMPYEDTKTRLAPLGSTGKFLHEFRDRKAWFATSTKGFFDMGDIAWLMDPSLCQMDVVPAPQLERHLQFKPSPKQGQMLRVSKIDVPRTWELFYRSLQDSQSIQ